MQALSINASWYGVNRVAEKMMQLENEKLAALVAQYVWRPLRCSAHGRRDRRRRQQAQFAVRCQAATSMAMNSPIPSSIRAGKSADELGCMVLCTRSIFRK
jgi:hypothetical protein